MSHPLPIHPAAASTSASPTAKSSSWDLSNPPSPCFFKLVPLSPRSLSSVCCALETRQSVLRRALWKEGSLEESSASLHLQPILSETEFDRVVAEAQQLEEAVLVVWMASWCRKCIYLKPKLEKLAADYYPRLRFYSIDVNAVSHKLVARAGVTKMPIIQLWKDSKKQAEVIGGHKAYLVINEVQEMIENECYI